mgnify:CR=1 FL=1
MNVFKKFYDYYFPKINKAYMAEMIKILDEKEKKIFLEMSEYDKFHSLEVLKKIKKTEHTIRKCNDFWLSFKLNQKFL